MNHFIKAVIASVTLVGATGGIAAQDFPLTITHVYGETVIPAQPERIVTWGWVTQDVVLALGEVPVAIPFFEYGGGADGMLPWTRDALAATGQTATVLANTPEPPYEQILALNPDVILAIHSGLTEGEYRRLSQIAPVIAYPDAAWATPMNTVISITGRALGRSVEAEAMIADLDAYTKTEAARFPELAGTSFASFRTGDGAAYVYNRNAAGVTFLEGLGLHQSDSVTELDKGDSYYFELSFENFGALKSEILVGFFDTRDDADTFVGQSYIRATPQVGEGAIASIVGADFDVAISPPSPLSLKWALPQYLELVAAAVKNAKR